MNENKQLIESLQKSDLYQVYERALAEVTGLPVALQSAESWGLPFLGKGMENQFCTLMASTGKSCAACLRFQEKLLQSAAHKPVSLTCSYGLCETAVPLRLGDKTIGFLRIGQVHLQKPTLAQFNRIEVQMNQCGCRLDPAAVRQAYFRSPVVSPKKLKAVSHLLAIFAEHLSLLSNQLVMRSATPEPSGIKLARQYIQAHLADRLSLASVASAAHMSLFYFCKMFKKSAGLTFTEFVSRTRVEKACDLLLNRHLRIGEIAYEAGFHSLTHFNRVFKKCMGLSPTRYRGNLPLA